jgi:hypothetical protein
MHKNKKTLEANEQFKAYFRDMSYVRCRVTSEAGS